MPLALTPIRTSRLVLEPTRSIHADAMWHAVRSSLEELKPWMAWANDTDHPSTRDFTIAAERAWMADTSWSFTIFFAGDVAGTISLDGHDRILKSARVGYWVRSDLAGRGLVSEAVSAIVEFAFEVVGLHRLELHASPANAASVRVAEKIGFSRRGLLRDGSRGSGGWHDVHVFDLLESDPRKQLHR
ncbi:MAG: GNAT family N-acetyltransferase [Actinomycetota bacterium]